MAPLYTIYTPQKVIRQAAMIAWVDLLGAITVEALAVREELSAAAARERLDEAVELGLLERHAVLVGYSDLYAASAAGRKLAHQHAGAGGYTCPQGMRAARVSIKQSRHTIARASVVAALERRYPEHRVVSERELHRDESRQGRRLASVEVRSRGQTESHFPDVAIWPPSTPGEPQELPVAVEVELTKKYKQELMEICRGLARSHLLEATVYYAGTPQVEEKLLEVIEELKAQETIVVNPLSEIVESLPGFDLGP
jgi:DNA-binding Lrp family transcriptional regulator